jgi:cobalt-zinc-cadmium efflux system protein
MADHHHHHAGDEHGAHPHYQAQIPRQIGRSFLVAIALNVALVVTEAVYGILAGSMALVADAGHNLSDVLGLTLSLGALILARRKPTNRRTYGLRGTTILASLANAVVLLVVTGGVIWESIRRLLAPQEIAGKTVIVVALIGVVVNGVSAALFTAGRKDDLNLRSAFLHLLSDAGLAFGVAVAAGVMMVTGWRWLDPVVSVALSCFILVSTWDLLKRSLDLVLDAVPEGVDPESVRAYLAGLPGVCEVHDLHIWAMSTTETALTAHLVMPGNSCHPRFLSEVGAELQHRFRIEHATLQVEAPEAPDPCRLAPDGTL